MLNKPFQFFLLFIAIGSAMAGCASTKYFSSDSELLTGIWRVEDIDQRGVMDYAMTTVQFDEENRISGSTGCNQYSGTLETGSGNFAVSQVVSTRRACTPAAMDQEQRFLAALEDATHYQIEADIWLVIYDESDKPRLKLIQMAPPSGPEN